MAAALKPVQRSDGFWNMNLAYTNDYPGPESSGTAMFTYGLAWGIHHGYLDAPTYLPTVIKGWNALSHLRAAPQPQHRRWLYWFCAKHRFVPDQQPAGYLHQPT